MNLLQLIELFRVEADDLAEPQAWSDQVVVALLNEAETEGAIRRKLIYDTTTPEVCEITVTAGTAAYALHSAVFEIGWAAFSAAGNPDGMVRVHLKSRQWLDSNVPDWRSRSGEPRWLVHDDKQVQLVPKPAESGTLRLEAYRVPLEPMGVPVRSDPEDPDSPMTTPREAPEIAAHHHAMLVQWAIHKAFGMPDVDRVDSKRSREAELRFEQYFGPRPDADLRRDMTADVPHHNVSYF